MPPFKRPDLPPGALRELIDALHSLHLAAGYPSTRTLHDDLETAGVSHTTIHNVFTTGRLPRWGVVDVLTEAMAKRAGRDESAEVGRIRDLWARAADVKENVSSGLKTSKNNENAEMGPRGPMVFIPEILPDALYEIEAAGTKKNIKDYRVPTGFDDLDALIGGWSAGTLIVVGGRPSSGKTSLMLNFSTAASYGSGIASMFVSGEENSRELAIRILSSITRVPLLYMRTGQLSDDDWRRLARSITKLADAPISFNSSVNLSLGEITAEAARLAGRLKLRLMLIDGFLSLVDRDYRDHSFKVETVLRDLRALAQTLNITVIVSVPTNRPENGFTKIDARLLPESAAIERVADVIIILDRPDQDERESPRAGEADLWVVKNRYGPEAAILVAWQGHYTRFVDMSANEYPIFPREKERNSDAADAKVSDSVNSAEPAVKDDPWNDPIVKAPELDD